MTDLPNVDLDRLVAPDLGRLEPSERATHPPRILLLYGSLRTRSYSRLLTLEAERILQHLGAETRVFDPAGLPMPDSVPVDHPKVELPERPVITGTYIRPSRELTTYVPDHVAELMSDPERSL